MAKNSDNQNISYSSVQTQRQLRIDKAKKLEAMGHNPFTPYSHRDFTLAKVKQEFELFKSHSSLTLAGRIKTKRTSGKIAFAVVEDDSLPDGFQFVLKKDLLDPETSAAGTLDFDDFKTLFDEGDYIQVTGYLDYSQSGEPSLFVTKFEMLTKALRPLPETLDYENVESRYLDRVADFKMNTVDEQGRHIRDIIKLKSKYWQIWREQMLAEGFLEVETPVLHPTQSGAEAQPFVTYYNELDQEVYLRMELELYQKRMIAGGFERTFEIGRQFRNEGSSPQHLQEYTQIEWYGAYLDYNYGMHLTKRIYQQIVREILGQDTQIDYYGHEINWGDWCTQEEADKNGWELLEGWPKIPYYQAMRYFSKGEVDVENKSLQELVKIAKELGLEGVNEDLGLATVMDKIWKKVRLNTLNPFFLILPPVELEPLAKRHPANPKLTERFQVVAGTAELGKGFSELNDPIDQFERFQTQQQAKDAGNAEAMGMDEEYVKALEYGTPPMAGFGTSERFFSFLLGKHIKETVTFPPVRSQDKDKERKAKKTMVAHAVILNTPEIPNWTKLNTAAHLSASLGSRQGKKLIWIDESITRDDERIPMNIQHAIIMKETQKRENLLKLKREAEKLGLFVTCFTEEMRDSTNDAKVQEWQQGKSADQIGWLGVLVFGKKSDVEELTEGFERVGE